MLYIYAMDLQTTLICFNNLVVDIVFRLLNGVTDSERFIKTVKWEECVTSLKQAIFFQSQFLHIYNKAYCLCTFSSLFAIHPHVLFFRIILNLRLGGFVDIANSMYFYIKINCKYYFKLW